MRTHVPAGNGDACCGNNNPGPLLSMSNVCDACCARVWSLVHAVRRLAMLRGYSELAATDKKLARLVEWCDRVENYEFSGSRVE